MQFLSKMFLIVSMILLSQVAFLAQGVARGIDLKAVYRLSNEYSGNDRFLTVIEDDDEPLMVELTRSPKQLWKFISLGGQKFRIVNLFEGEDRSLDVNEKGNLFSIVMADSGNYSGQSWWFDTQKDGKVRFMNDFTGGEMSLDAKNKGDLHSLFMGRRGNYSGQVWTLTKATQ
jgi:hypothetical protein